MGGAAVRGTTQLGSCLKGSQAAVISEHLLLTAACICVPSIEGSSGNMAGAWYLDASTLPNLLVNMAGAF